MNQTSLNTTPIGVIAAAGGGTRMWPASKAYAKEMFPVGKLPAIAHVIWEMVEAGIQRIVIVVRKDSFKPIEALLDPSICPPDNMKDDVLVRQFEYMIRAATFTFVEQAGPYGNGTPLLDAMRIVKREPCVYAFADDVVFGENATAGLMKVFRDTGHPVLATQIVPQAEVSRFGILECAETGQVSDVTRFVEKPSSGTTKSRLASLGRYLITTDVVNALETTPPGKNGEIWLSDAFVQLLSRGIAVSAFRLTKGRWYTVGNPDGFGRAVRAGLRLSPRGILSQNTDTSVSRTRCVE